MAMETKRLGRTGMQVGRLGIGLSEVGFNLELTDVDQARSVINQALDSGVNFLDTAACYGISEELVGLVASERRDEYVLATKAGHYLPRNQGEDWTYDLVVSSVDRSLNLMKTDHIDLLQLHSCGVEVLEKGEVIRALQDVRASGKTRFIGYSGDNENAKWAVTSGLFDTLQTSFNLVDQSARINLFEDAEERGLLKHGDTIVEPTSGNTGIGLAMVAAVKGYKAVFVMAANMSEERIRILKAFGSELILTPAEKGTVGAIEEARRLEKKQG